MEEIKRHFGMYDVCVCVCVWVAHARDPKIKQYCKVKNEFITLFVLYIQSENANIHIEKKIHENKTHFIHICILIIFSK